MSSQATKDFVTSLHNFVAHASQHSQPKPAPVKHPKAKWHKPSVTSGVAGAGIGAAGGYLAGRAVSKVDRMAEEKHKKESSMDIKAKLVKAGSWNRFVKLAAKIKNPQAVKKAMLRKRALQNHVFVAFAEKAAAADSDAAALGLLVGYETAVMPKMAVFEKVAAKTGYDPKLLKLAYLRKMSATWPWLLGGLGAAAVGAPMLSNAYHRLMSPGYYGEAPGWGLMDAPNVGMYGGLSPRSEQELWRTISREGLKNRQMSSLLQGISGAYRPAGNPWGAPQQMSMAQ